MASKGSCGAKWKHDRLKGYDTREKSKTGNMHLTICEKDTSRKNTDSQEARQNKDSIHQVKLIHTEQQFVKYGTEHKGWGAWGVSLEQQRRAETKSN